MANQNLTYFFTYYEPVRFIKVFETIKENTVLYDPIIDIILSYIGDAIEEYHKQKIVQTIQDTSVIYCYWTMNFEIQYFDSFTNFRSEHYELSFFYKTIPKAKLVYWLYTLSVSACCWRKRAFYEFLGNEIIDAGLNIRTIYINDKFIQLDADIYDFTHGGDLDFFPMNFSDNLTLFRNTETTYEQNERIFNMRQDYLAERLEYYQID